MARRDSHLILLAMMALLLEVEFPRRIDPITMIRPISIRHATICLIATDPIYGICALVWIPVLFLFLIDGLHG